MGKKKAQLEPELKQEDEEELEEGEIREDEEDFDIQDEDEDEEKAEYERQAYITPTTFEKVKFGKDGYTINNMELIQLRNTLLTSKFPESKDADINR